MNMSSRDPNMHFVTHEIPSESLCFAVWVVHFDRAAWDL